MSLVLYAAYVCLTWSFFIVVVQVIGSSRLFRHFSSPPRPPVSPSLPRDHVPHVTVIRPVKGLEPFLYECIASTFRQDYPADKLTVHLCVAEATDPAYPILRRVVADFPHIDARIFVEREDPVLHGEGGHVDNLGPNPKIRNMSRAYREARGDVIWVIDCNVWIPRVAAGHMVDKLIGLGPNGEARTPYKFVHQLPLVVDTANLRRTTPDAQHLLGSPAADLPPSSLDTLLKDPADRSWLAQLRGSAGGRLDEMFMATTHAKFYAAINTVGVAPCIVGKSNMFRRSHLDELTAPLRRPGMPHGIDYFSSYICEDHLIGDLLFRSRIPGFANHGLVLGDLAIQPMDGMSVGAYVARRVRWLRARKWTVLLATLVEPGVESILCCTYLSFALTTIPWFRTHLHVPQTWTAMALCWLLAMAAWAVVDRRVFRRLHSGKSVAVDQDTPFFARGTTNAGGVRRRQLGEWFVAWVTREVLALPIWTWAVLLGTTVKWRGKTFTVRMDMSVVEREDGSGSGSIGDFIASCRGTPESEGGRGSRSKNRVD